MSGVGFTVLVPAYNEASVLHRSLTPLRHVARAGEVQVIVIANGCSDDTARVAQQICPQAEVLETPVASKTQAMNLGFAQARGRAILCLDADLGLSEAALRALAAPLLEGRADAVCGRMVPDLSGSSAVVRSFYRGWALNPYFDQGKFGGVYGMTRALAQSVFPMPEVIADDEYVARQVAGHRTAYVAQARFDVRAPAGLRDLLKIRRRSRRGTAALEQTSGTAALEKARGTAALEETSGTAALEETSGTALSRAARPTNGASFAIILRRALRRPARWPDVAVYAALIAWVRMGLALRPARPQTAWERDDSSRAPLQESPS